LPKVAARRARGDWEEGRGSRISLSAGERKRWRHLHDKKRRGPTHILLGMREKHEKTRGQNNRERKSQLAAPGRDDVDGHQRLTASLSATGGGREGGKTEKPAQTGGAEEAVRCPRVGEGKKLNKKKRGKKDEIAPRRRYEAVK